jgi:hypothetical protein
MQTDRIPKKIFKHIPQGKKKKWQDLEWDGDINSNYKADETGKFAYILNLMMVIHKIQTLIVSSRGCLNERRVFLT